MNMKRNGRIGPMEFLRDMAYEFPGLLIEGHEVNGADLVDWISHNLPELKTGTRWLMEKDASISIEEGHYHVS